MDAQWSEMKSYEEGGSGWMVVVLLMLSLVISAFNIWRKLRKRRGIIIDPYAAHRLRVQLFCIFSALVLYSF